MDTDNDNHNKEWQTVENDPDVFTEMIHCLGIPNYVCEDVVEIDQIPTLTKCVGLIFLFLWDEHDQQERMQRVTPTNDIVFCKQMANNDCATQVRFIFIFI